MANALYMMGIGAVVATLLSVSWPVATTNAGPPVPIQEGPADSDRCGLPSAANSIQVVETKTITHIFEEGGVTALKSGWVVAGVEADSRADLPDEVVPFRQTRIYQQEVGEVELPARPAGVQIAMPLPVPLSEDRWGLVWAEARPPEGFDGRWHPQHHTQLWFSERQTDGWSEPRLLLRAQYFLDWKRGRVTRYLTGRGTFIVVLHYGMAGRSILFGNVEGNLQEVPLPAGLVPDNVVLQVDESGSMVVVAEVGYRDNGHAGTDLIMLRSDDEGKSWSAPETIWTVEFPRGYRTLQLVIDPAGNEHVLWSRFPQGIIRHIWRSKSDESWQSATIPAPNGDLLDWIAGVDRCQQFTLIRAVIALPKGPHFESATWNATWSSFREALQDFEGTYLFNGLSHDGRWYLGWSGHISQETAVDSISKLWITPH